MKKDFIVVKRDLSTADNIYLIRSGIYYVQPIKSRYPYIDFSNTDYFEEVTKDILEPGTRVLYKGHKWYIIKTAETCTSNYGINKLVNVGKIKGWNSKSDINVKYYIGQSVDAREKDMKLVSSSELEASIPYWFINSEGSICKAFLGDKPEVDKWRTNMNNMYASQQDARKAYDIIVKHLQEKEK